MRVLSFSADRKLCNEKSDVAARHRMYGEYVETLDIIVYTHKDHACEPLDLSHTVRVHPTQSRNKWWYVWDAIRLARTLEKPTLVSVQDPFDTGVAGYVVSRLFGVPLHVQVHTDMYTSGFVRAHKLNWLRRFIAPFVLRRAACIRVVSERAKEGIEKHVGPQVPIHVFPVFVDVAKYQSIVRAKHPRYKIALLSVGRLEKEKQFEKSIDALALLRAHKHDAGLIIVGDGREKDSLEQYAHTHNVHDRVRFVGWADNLEPHLSVSDILLHPSAYEGYGMVIVEALASGIPVIATDVGVASEVGAIIATEKTFADTVLAWVERGPRQGNLTGYPYTDLSSYAEDYVAHLKRCVHN